MKFTFESTADRDEFIDLLRDLADGHLKERDGCSLPGLTYPILKGKVYALSVFCDSVTLTWAQYYTEDEQLEGAEVVFKEGRGPTLWKTS